MLSERNQTEKDTHRTMSLTRGILKARTQRNREQTGGCQWGWGGEMGDRGLKVQTSSYRFQNVMHSVLTIVNSPVVYI